MVRVPEICRRTEMNAPTTRSIRPGLLREEIRAARHTTVTTGLAPGHVQANLVILPADWAEEFAAFCAANPKPCPLIAQSEPGDPTLPTLGATSTSAATCRAIASFVTVRPCRKKRTSPPCGATTSSPSPWDAPIRSRRRCSTPGADPSHRAGQESLHLSHRARHRAGRTPAWPHGGVDAQLHRAQRHPRHRDHLALPAGARRADPLRRSRGDRHRRHRQARVSAASPTSDPARCRCSGPAG